MSLQWYDFVGLAGVGFVLLCYFLLQAGKLDGNAVGYQFGNLFGAVFILALVWPVDLGGPATTTAATAAVDPVFRPFTGVYALFSGWGDAWGGITALSLVFAVLTGLFLLPWIDRSSEVAAGRRKVFVVPSLVVLLLLLLLIFVGEGLP